MPNSPVTMELRNKHKAYLESWQKNKEQNNFKTNFAQQTISGCKKRSSKTVVQHVRQEQSPKTVSILERGVKNGSTKTSATDMSFYTH